MKLFNKRLRLNGQTSLFHTRADINELMNFCNMLADRVDEVIEENNKLLQALDKTKEAVAILYERADNE